MRNDFCTTEFDTLHRFLCEQVAEGDIANK